jgi:pimeloyl-ACP methyl ester carboxylesterase
MSYRIAIAVLLVAACSLAACDDDSQGDHTPTADTTQTARALPTPVTIPDQPAENFTLGDPSLEALPGAKTDFGRLGGMNYQVEIPDNWNHRLVLYMHGNDQDSELQVYPPINREYLVDHGYAWASSSYSVNVAVVSGVAADETAAVWDYFVQKYGRPEYTYAMGDSMGGSATFISAERYPDRYDGALPLCADADAYQIQGDFFTAAAYVAGVTPQQWDAANHDVGAVIDSRLRPVLRDPAQRTRFISLWSDITGGARPLVDEGVALYQENIWTYVIGNLFQGVYDNANRKYELHDGAGVGSDDYNAGIIRITGKPGADQYHDTNTITGSIQVPTLIVQPTGDALTIFWQAQELARRAKAAGKQDLLVSRAIQSPQHCFDRGLTQGELADAFEALVAWVEQGNKPQGEDLLGDITNAGAQFTHIPRAGSNSAARLPGADKRLTIHGAITLDGQPVQDGFLWAEVVTNGVARACSYRNAAFDVGTYTLQAASADETRYCGAPGTQLRLMYFKDGNRYRGQSQPWPEAVQAEIPLAFTSADLQQERPSAFHGFLHTKDGSRPEAGTTIQQYVGDRLCGVAGIPAVLLVFDDDSGYDDVLSSDADVPACARGADVEFRVNDAATSAHAANDYAPGSHRVDLTLP